MPWFDLLTGCFCLHTGTKEASFGYALFSAGVTYALSEACTRANFSYCSCGSEHDLAHQEEEVAQEEHAEHLQKREVTSNLARQEWKWNGCRHNVDFGSEMARLFLDSQEQFNVSPYSLANLHNNLIGRRVSACTTVCSSTYCMARHSP